MSTTISDDVRTYLNAVRERLADLPAEEREHLVSDAEPSLLEGEGSPYVRLGPPERFADELRSAAGFPPLPPPAAPAAGLPRRLMQLAPLWWVARAYLVLALLAQFVGGWAYGYPWMPVFHDARETLALGFIAVAISMAIGLRRRPPRRWAVALNVAVLVIGVPVAVAETHSHSRWTPPPTVVARPLP
jgi:hypothetical protein